MIREPMLCYRPKKQQQLDIHRLRWDKGLYVSPKIDAFRALITPNTDVVSRRLRKFPNRYVQKMFGYAAFIGFDGELVAGDPTAPDVFLRTQSAVMSEDTVDKELKLYVFDYYLSNEPFRKRLQRIVFENLDDRIVIVPQDLVHSAREALELEEKYCAMGYEGIILRNPDAPYKQGRSTLDEQYLLKLKRFNDSEAEILEAEEMLHNDNVATRDARGKTKRSKSKDGMRPAGMLGRLKVRDIHTNVEFYVGSGQPFFTLEGRMKFWRIRDQIVRQGRRPGKIMKYRFQDVGQKGEVPRFPRSLAFRDEIDL